MLDAIGNCKDCSHGFCTMNCSSAKPVDRQLMAFVRESNRIEGIQRTTAEEYLAHARFLERPQITVDDLIALVAVLQPDARLRDKKTVPGVRVGNHIAPPSGPHIRNELESILKMAGSSYHQHIAYETLHPFTDGNGRSGRALWLHRRGSAPLGFLHHFYYQTLEHCEDRKT